MNITYLHHSGVSISHEKKLFIFDYYQKGINTDDFSIYDEIYVLVSHRHHDHFDKEILQWDSLHENIFYVFSDDVKKKVKVKHLNYMSPSEDISINGISITSYPSTDEGIAFLVSFDDFTVFHAGDLNWWHWEEESEAYNINMARDFCREIDKLKNIEIDVAFIPVDQRLNKASYYAIDYLMENVKVKSICPIHFADDFTYLKKVSSELAKRKYYDKINFYREDL